MSKRLLLTLFAGVLMAALDIAILGPAQPALRSELAIGPGGASWLVSLYVLANLVGTPLLGHLSDRHGRKPIYLLSVSLFAAGSFGMTLGHSLTVLLISRALQGFGSGGLFPVASAVIGETIEPARQGRMLGLLGSTFGIAFLIGPPLGGILLKFASWRWIFALNIPLSVAVLVLAARSIPSRRPRGGSALDIAGLALFAAGLVLLAIGLSGISPNQPGWGLAHPQVWGPLAGSLVLLAALPSVERRATSPLLSPALVRNPVLRRVFLLGLGAGLGEVGVILLPDLAVQAMGMAKDKASFLLLPLVLGLTVGAPLSGRLLDRIGARPLVLLGALLQAGSLGAFGLFPTTTLLYDVAGAGLGVGLACLLAGPLRWLLLRHAPEENRAVAQSLLSTTHSVGQVATAALLGAVAETGIHGIGHQRALAVAGALSLLLLIPAWLLPGRQKA
jgi:multidrug resistance protein